jgi:hypothetical protein
MNTLFIANTVAIYNIFDILFNLIINNNEILTCAGYFNFISLAVSVSDPADNRHE